MDAISCTAQWTAAIRALESEHGIDSLFRDELAWELAKPDGFSLLKKYCGGGVREFVVIRTRYFDDLISEIVTRDKIRQVVMVAAGMDTRAFRLKWPEHTIIFEIDHKSLLDEKRRRLSALDVVASTSKIEIPANLSKPWLKYLIAHGFDVKKKTLWVAEGIFCYMTEEQAKKLLTTLSGASAQGSRLLVDMVSQSLLQSPMTRAFLSTMKASGIPWQFGTDEPICFLQALGWETGTLREPGQTFAGLRRWPYRQYEETIKNVPRNWLIQAEIASSSGNGCNL